MVFVIATARCAATPRQSAEIIERKSQIAWTDWTCTRVAATLLFTLRERQGHFSVGHVKFSQLWTSSWLRAVTTIVGVGTFLAILAPYGSSRMGWPWLWIYWVGIIGLGATIGYVTSHWLPRLMPKVPKLVVYAAIVITVSVPVTVAVLALGTDFFARTPDLADVLTTYAMVLVISSFVAAVSWTLEKVFTDTPPDIAARPSPALLDKLPHRLRKAELLSMSAEDHYLRVRTDPCEDLILMRLSDAVAACEALDGARTHRSWWVARDAVHDVRKGDGRATLILSDGTEAPVSRTYYPKLRDAGWF